MRHVIVGKGPAGVIAAETLRAQDSGADIILIGDEPEPAYSRMAIPYLLAGEITEQGTWLRRDPDHFERLRIEQLNTRVEAIDSTSGSVTLANGAKLDYDRLLLATGSSALTPPIEGLDQARIHHCWTMDDARQLIELATPGSRVILMGAGFIGCIVMEALRSRGVHLTVVEMGDRMVPRMMDQVAGNLIKQWCLERQVEVRTSTRITSVDRSGKGLTLHLDPQGVLQADLMVIAAGVRPNTGFLEGSGVEVRDGIIVDRFQHTSSEGIFAAGDVCEGIEWQGGGRAVHAIQPVAAETGRIAALNMAGMKTPYRGSMGMNVLDTLGLISVSFGQWEGIQDGDSGSLLNDKEYRYIKLQFDEDRLIGGIALGTTEHVGVLRGLIQSRRRLGRWKQRLQANPSRLMEAWVASNS